MHIRKCGHEHLRVVSEHDDDSEVEVIDLHDDETRKAFLRETIYDFPHTDEWKLMAKTAKLQSGDIKTGWVKKELEWLESDD